MAKAQVGWTRCPICNTRLRAEKLDGHMKNVHPKGVSTREARAKIVGRRKTASKAGRYAALAAVIIILILVIYFVWTNYQPRGSNVGDKPYNFTLRATDGTDYTLDDHLGDMPILISFMSTRCSHCANTVDKTIVPLSINYTNKVEFLIILSNQEATQSESKAWAEEHDIEFTILLDKGGSVFEQYDPGLSGYPTLYLVGKDSKVHWKVQGEVNYADLEKEIKDVI